MFRSLGLKILITTTALTFAPIASDLLATNSGDYWDGEAYHQHSSSQKDAASDLMKYIQLTDTARILDIGCGDGKITAGLSKQLPNGRVLGIDISPSMVGFANSAFPKTSHGNLDFELMSAEAISFDNQFDYALSFTALQWIHDHHLIIKNVKKSLKPKGIFGATMPMGLPKALQAAVDVTILDTRWNAYFTDFNTGWNFTTKESYQQLLESEGFVIKRAQVVKQEDVFPSLVVFKGFISQWFTYLRPLPTSLKEAFMDAVLSKYINNEPLDKQGRLHFNIDRLEVVAEKSA